MFRGSHLALIVRNGVVVFFFLRWGFLFVKFGVLDSGYFEMLGYAMYFGYFCFNQWMYVQGLFGCQENVKRSFYCGQNQIDQSAEPLVLVFKAGLSFIYHLLLCLVNFASGFWCGF